jgi:TOMM system kinase/cyclase fusion protein
MVCPKCGFNSPQSFAFCGRCGSPTTLTRSLREAEDPQLARAERRQLSVMFCDLVGSTTLSGQLDPEELSDVTRAYHSLCAEIIERHAGRVAQFMGDGLLVYFGYPLSHEDDAQRAVRAGLEIVAVVASARERLGRPLQVRVAVHTGLAVVGQLGGETNPDPMAISGETPNIAARLQSIAEPGQVVISAATYKLIQGFFVCRSLGTPALKGVGAPIEVFEIIEPTSIHTRFEKAIATGLTPFVSREQEVGQLLDLWRRARDGSGQVVLLSGEPGIGKSRLVRMLAERAAGEPALEFTCRCSPYYQNSALYPAIEFLQRMLRFNRNDDPGTKLAKLEDALARFGFSPSEMVVPLFAALLSLPATDRYPTVPMTPQRQKQNTFAVIIEWLMRNAERAPIRLIAEDLHWADPSTLELLGLLIEQVAAARLLLILVFRPEFAPPWPSRPHITNMVLGRLPDAATELMIQAVADGNQLPAELTREIIGKTEGVPLFVEELTRMVLESGLMREQDGRYVLTRPLPSLAIPSTLYDSLMARLDRLGTAKEIAQLASTIGKEFSYELLQAVSPLEETRLTGALNRLVDAELLIQRVFASQISYSFKHALIRDAAYESLLRSKRRQHHAQIATVLQERFPEIVDSHPELLASHYQNACLAELAIPWWQDAGQKAIQRSANAEAIIHLTTALETLKTLPQSQPRAQQELALQVTLGVPLMLTKGYGAPEVERIYTRARELYHQVGESPQFFPILIGLWVFHRVKAEYSTARTLGEQLVTLAETAQDPALLVEAHTAYGDTLSFSGELVLARKHLEQAVALYDSRRDSSHAFVYGRDPGVHSLSYATLTLWLLGYPDQARKRSLEALALAQELSHPFSIAFALIHVVHTHRFTREVKATEERAKELHVLSSEQGFPLPLAFAAAHEGWSLAEQGLVKEGIIQIREAIDTWNATGATLFFKPFLFAMLAEAYEKGGSPEEGLNILTEALSVVNTTGEHFWEAELYRLKGDLTLQRQVQGLRIKAQDEAEECFRRAIDIARQQSAKSLELRAVMSLSRLWRHQGEAARARKILAGTYGWFTEGFDTSDLREARVLLESDWVK